MIWFTNVLFVDLHFGGIDIGGSSFFIHKKRRRSEAEVNVRGLYYEDLHFFFYPSIYVSTYVPRVLLQWNVKVTDEEVVVVDVYHSNRDRDEDEEMLQI